MNILVYYKLLIDCELPTNPLDIEAIKNWVCGEILLKYYGNLHEESLKSLHEYYKGPLSDILVITGPYGIGKSTLLANFTKEIYNSHMTVYNYIDSIFTKPLPSLFLCREDIVKLGVITKFIGQNHDTTAVNKIIDSLVFYLYKQINDIAELCEFHVPKLGEKNISI